jgi:hypothetical protein
MIRDADLPGLDVALRAVVHLVAIGGALMSLGYEPTDVRLRFLGQSLVTALTSADLWA